MLCQTNNLILSTLHTNFFQNAKILEKKIVQVPKEPAVPESFYFDGKFCFEVYNFLLILTETM